MRLALFLSPTQVFLKYLLTNCRMIVAYMRIIDLSSVRQGSKTTGTWAGCGARSGCPWHTKSDDWYFLLFAAL